jgi:Amt family ammonium transporter
VGPFASEGGLFYGGGNALLGSQLLGVLAIAAWASELGFLLFFILNKTIGIRVSKTIEEEGLDIYEHGESAYNI